MARPLLLRAHDLFKSFETTCYLVAMSERPKYHELYEETRLLKSAADTFRTVLLDQHASSEAVDYIDAIATLAREFRGDHPRKFGRELLAAAHRLQDEVYRNVLGIKVGDPPPTEAQIDEAVRILTS